MKDVRKLKNANDVANYCYLVVPVKGPITPKWKKSVKDFCVRMPQVYCVTDHGFLKAKATSPVQFPRSTWIYVKDQTKHYDEAIWFYTYNLWKHARLRRIKPRKVLAIFIHYFLNLEGVWPEAPWFKRMAQLRSALEKSTKVTAKVDHGWEIKELQKAGLYGK